LGAVAQNLDAELTTPNKHEILCCVLRLFLLLDLGSGCSEPRRVGGRRGVASEFWTGREVSLETLSPLNVRVLATTLRYALPSLAPSAKKEVGWF